MLLGQEPTASDSIPYLAQMGFEWTSEGCFQFALFCMLIRRFYLSWHSNYNNRSFILTTAGLQRFADKLIGRITPEELALLRASSPHPQVRMENAKSEIRLLNYEPNISYSFLRISIATPNIFLEAKDEVLIKNHGMRLF